MKPSSLKTKKFSFHFHTVKAYSSESHLTFLNGGLISFDLQVTVCVGALQSPKDCYLFSCGVGCPAVRPLSLSSMFFCLNWLVLWRFKIIKYSSQKTYQVLHGLDAEPPDIAKLSQSLLPAVISLHPKAKFKAF